MTALCGGGPSQALPNVGPVVAIGGGAAAAFLEPLVGPAMSEILGSIVGALIDIDVNNYCGTDPPPDPGLTPLDVVAAIAVPPTALTFPAQLKVIQWFKSQYWWKICECVSGTPTPPPAPSNPGPASQNPGLPSGSSSNPCWNVTASIPVPAGGGTSGTAHFVDATAQTLPVTTPSVTISPPPNFPSTAYQIPNGVTSVQWTTAVDSQFLVNVLPAVDMSVYPSAGSTGVTTAFGNIGAPGSPLSASGVYTVPSTEHYWTFTIGNPDTVPHTFTVSLQFFCSGQGPTDLTVPCCPPDPIQEFYLRQILNIVSNFKSGGLTGYTKGAVHSSLTGSASLTVTGLAGIEVNITAAPPTKQQPGNPPYLWDMGWLSCMTGDGMIDEKRLTRTNQVWLPALASLATVFGYYLNPGVTATITELLPA